MAAITRRIQGSGLLLDLVADAELLDNVDAIVVVVVLVVAVVVVLLGVVAAVVAVVLVVAGGAATVSVALMPTFPPPQRTPIEYVSGGVVAGMANWMLNLPLASRGACGPNPSGPNSTSLDVSCAASSAGQPAVETIPAMVTVAPGAAVDG